LTKTSIMTYIYQLGSKRPEASGSSRIWRSSR
uniref:Uncharacterized protein n=1 Tax=Aegilops tauschii subsp. strangulata TaxID=200361 RepID=A0A453BW34_AEGTS